MPGISPGTIQAQSFSPRTVGKWCGLWCPGIALPRFTHACVGRPSLLLRHKHRGPEVRDGHQHLSREAGGKQERAAPAPADTQPPASAGHQCTRAGAAGEALRALAGNASVNGPWVRRNLCAEHCAAGTGPDLTPVETGETRGSISRREVAPALGRMS